MGAVIYKRETGRVHRFYPFYYYYFFIVENKIKLKTEKKRRKTIYRNGWLETITHTHRERDEFFGVEKGACAG